MQAKGKGYSGATFVPLTFHKLVQFRHYTGIILGSGDKKFAVYGHPSMVESFGFSGQKGCLGEELFHDREACGCSSKKSMGNHKEEVSRPFAYDLLHFVLSGLEVKVSHVLINDYKDNVFYSRIFLDPGKKDGIARVIEVDARPSDSIPLALSHKAPLFCLQKVFDLVTPFYEE